MTPSIQPSSQPSKSITGDNDEPHSKRYAWMWGSVVVAFLILQLVIGGVAFNLASGDPSVAVMPDYHERALKWDDELARRQRSDRLGWNADFRWSDQVEDDQRRFVVQVVDQRGEAISGGAASVRFFHHARGGDVATMTLTEGEPGEYVAQLPMAKRGLWDVEFSLGRGDDEAFWKQATIEVGIDPDGDRGGAERASPTTDRPE
jgi:nitrogen fixation protein FixH